MASGNIYDWCNRHDSERFRSLANTDTLGQINDIPSTELNIGHHGPIRVLNLFEKNSGKMRYGKVVALVTGQLYFYGAAMKVIGRSDRRKTGGCLNNRTKNSHQSF